MIYGVGFIGSGPGVSALHLPTVARLGAFEPRHVADAGSGRAAGLGERHGLRHSTGIDDLLDDPTVDVVAVCSPPHLHAEQVLAAVEAGKRAVFCEKPLAVDAEEAEAVIAACRATGTAVVVGTNHLFDPAWARAKHHLVAHGGRVQTFSATVSLPPNGRYHELVSVPTDANGGAGAPAGGRPLPDWDDPTIAAAVLRQLVLGLCIHDLPLLRDVAPHIDRVVYARPVSPLGYCLGLLAGDILVQLTAVMQPGGADALWRISIGTDFDDLEVEFPPSFVHAGSAAVRVRSGAGPETRYLRAEEDGYEAEWRALADLIEGRVAVEYDELLDDARYSIDLADAVAASVLERTAVRP
ncbi:hypothetical protein GCM10010988_30500 [Cnuibacter physcomitrellae]|uniref:Dehydrogenase n=1 Tax=Cnuibacter physcomitrellae TaxID=1619308 RepID=A0A1X9LIG4_9MICO|nr:Gfo/Idh/MocA family oxidoreductase [Cnuibacter physcomitrellae]ARJ04302.1 dehydrogenase [Cnuibacter physcomitrellae]GGI40720.1 hypothetical protein GCM10010988_30500 [Cnuibacter physcomitrellae]